MFFDCFRHFGGFCSRAGNFYTQKKFKIVPPILIMGFEMGLFPFTNGTESCSLYWAFTNATGLLDPKLHNHSWLYCYFISVSWPLSALLAWLVHSLTAF